MKQPTRILALILAFATIISCTKTKLEGIYNRQENQIDTYVSKYEGDHRIVYRGGSSRIIMTEGQGDSLSVNGYVSFYYAGYTFSGNVSNANMFITNHKETAERAGWNLTDADYGLYEIKMSDAELLPGLKEGLIGVKAGEECEILFSGKYGIGSKPFGIIPANSALLYKIWDITVSNE